jgi:hypothetical protein
MKIEVRPIEKKRWHGKKGKESFKRPTILSALVNTKSMTYDTGLNEEQRERLEKSLGVNLDNRWNRDVPHEFWDSRMGQVKLENRTMFFDTNIPLEEVYISMLKASKYVANSKTDLDLGRYPEAEFVIFDEKEEIGVKAKKVALKRKATKETSGLSKSRKDQLVLLLTGKNFKDKSSDFLDVEIDKLIESGKSSEILHYLSRDTSLVSTEALVKEALQKSVLKKSGHKILYHDSVLGSEIEDVAQYFMLPENQDLKIRIMESIK